MVDNRVSPPRIDEDARVERQNSLSLLELCTVPTGTGHYIPISHKIAPAVLAAIQFATIDENGSQHVRVGLSALVTLFYALQIFWERTGSLPCAAIHSYTVCLCTSYTISSDSHVINFFCIYLKLFLKGKNDLKRLGEKVLPTNDCEVWYVFDEIKYVVTWELWLVLMETEDFGKCRKIETNFVRCDNRRKFAF